MNFNFGNCMDVLAQLGVLPTQNGASLGQGGESPLLADGNISPEGGVNIAFAQLLSAGTVDGLISQEAVLPGISLPLLEGVTLENIVGQIKGNLQEQGTLPDQLLPLEGQEFVHGLLNLIQDDLQSGSTQSPLLTALQQLFDTDTAQQASDTINFISFRFEQETFLHTHGVDPFTAEGLALPQGEAFAGRFKDFIYSAQGNFSPDSGTTHDGEFSTLRDISSLSDVLGLTHHSLPVPEHVVHAIETLAERGYDFAERHIQSQSYFERAGTAQDHRFSKTDIFSTRGPLTTGSDDNAHSLLQQHASISRDPNIQSVSALRPQASASLDRSADHAQTLSALARTASSTANRTEPHSTTFATDLSIGHTNGLSNDEARVLLHRAVTSEPSSAKDLLQHTTSVLDRHSGINSGSHDFSHDLRSNTARTHALTEQVSTQITKAIHAGKNSLSVRLEPADLGKLDIQLNWQAQSGKTIVAIVAERAETLDMLGKDLRNLVKDLQSAGLQLEGGDISLGLQQQQQEGTDEYFAHYMMPGGEDDSSDSGTVEEHMLSLPVQYDGMIDTQNGVDISV